MTTDLRHGCGQVGLYDLVRAPDPYSLYRRMQEEGPCYDEQSRCWLLTSYQDITFALTDERFTTVPAGRRSSRRVGDRPAVSSIIRQQMLFQDGAEHQRLQAIVSKPLMAMVKPMHLPIRAVVHRILEKVEMGAHPERMDAVGDFAVPVTLLSIAHLLGIPTQDDERLAQLKSWSDAFEHVTSGYLVTVLGDILKLADYFHGLLAEKRRQPGAADLLSVFVSTGLSGAGGQHAVFGSEEECIANCIMLLSAGRVTSEKLLGTGLAVLLKDGNPLTRNRQTYNINRVIDELLRIVTPTRWIGRWLTADVEISSRRLRAGEKALLFLEAANHDPRHFADPECFHPGRARGDHLAFGHPRNAHYCPGAPLARIEACIALELLLSRFPALHLDGAATLERQPNSNLGGWVSLPVLLR